MKFLGYFLLLLSIVFYIILNMYSLFEQMTTSSLVAIYIFFGLYFNFAFLGILTLGQSKWRLYMGYVFLLGAFIVLIFLVIEYYYIFYTTRFYAEDPSGLLQYKLHPYMTTVNFALLLLGIYSIKSNKRRFQNE